MFCREQAVQVHRAVPEFEALGASVSVIGNGRPQFIDAFRKVTEFEGAVLTDPSREAYNACGFLRGIRATFNARSLSSALRTMSAGYRQGLTRGDPWQQGGAVLVAPPNVIVAYHRSSRAGDHSPLDEMKAKLGEG